jgi:uncharacterized protein YndB with AHSA1/START domain
MAQDLDTMDVIEKSVTLPSPPDRVGRALTDHREFGAWFKVDLDGPFAVGRTTTGTMTHPGAEGLPFEATVVEMEPPRRFAYTWPHIDFSDNSPIDGETRVEFTLEPEAGGTRLTVRESGFENLPLRHRAETRRLNDGGWAAQMRYIAAYLARSD